MIKKKTTKLSRKKTGQTKKKKTAKIKEVSEKKNKKKTAQKAVTKQQPRKKGPNAVVRDTHKKTDAKFLRDLVKIGILLSSENDLELLLDKIVKEARSFTNADGGSLYLRENNQLRFTVLQNDSLKRSLGGRALKTMFGDIIIPISKKSISGYVAETGAPLNINDAYHLSANAPYSINKEVDKRDNYRTKSLLTVPMKNNSGEVIGILQLINAQDNGRIVKFKKSHEDLIMSLASQAAVAVQNAQLTESIKKSNYDIMARLLTAAEYRDTETGNHIKRMSNYCAVIAREMGMPKNEVELILYTSPMHDIGKIGIPDTILFKPGPLDPDERRIMERHTIIAGNIFNNPDNQITKACRIIALMHHEKWDGSGYPNGLRGDEIHIYGRIAALADVFDALSSKRCYKPAFPIDKVIDIIKKDTGSHFDPDVVEAFFTAFEEIEIIRNVLGNE